MLEIVSRGFNAAKALLTGQQTITEENIAEATRAIRVSLLEADVELGVVRTFLDRVKQRAIGEVVRAEVKKGNKKIATTPGEHFVLICHNELERLMGPVEQAPVVYRRPYTIVMMVGLQGTGKTTTCGKLASYFLTNNRRPLLVAADIYRPAAVDQLQILGKRLGVPVFAQEGLSPQQLCQDALREAKRKKRDVVVFDTAGRLAIDEALMQELDDIKRTTRPDNILLVCDAMAGQDAVRTASEFNRRLDLTGFVMTKLDGDARGGAALSIKEITGKPIKFLGTGEGLDKLEPFRPEGLASRILGMGDVVGLMKNFEQVVDEREAERDTRKLLRGHFTLDDFLKQLKMLQQVGSIKDIYERFPIFGDMSTLPEGARPDDGTFIVLESMIRSMTPSERTHPEIIDASRAQRIARGSGRKPEQVHDLLGRFQMLHTVMANFAAQPGLLGALPGFKQLGQLRQLKGKAGKGTGDIGEMIRQMAAGKAMPGMGFGGNGTGGMMPGGMPPGMMPGMPPGMMPGLPGMPRGGAGALAAMGARAAPQQEDVGAAAGRADSAGGIDSLPEGMTPEQYAAALRAMGGMGGARGAPGVRAVDAKAKQKSRQKSKAAKQARKKSRRR